MSALFMLRLRHTFYSQTRQFSISGLRSAHLNKPLSLDPSLRQLLQDVDISLLNQTTEPGPIRKVLQELPPSELVPFEVEEHSTQLEDDSEDLPGMYDSRKSPAAAFGSQNIGAVVLPLELQNTINGLVSGSDKHLLHSDAKRLFSDNKEEWDTKFSESYKSWQDAKRHGERDGTAFATVVLPAHYAAIVSVLSHLRHRMPPSWSVDRVLDWGSATGSSMWAAFHTFQQQATDDPRISTSSIQSYLSIDKRSGLTTIAKRLMRGIEFGTRALRWKRGYSDEDMVPAEFIGSSLAISAFKLTSLPNPLLRKEMVSQMWDSGAETIVLIDHGTPDGFVAITDAREHLLKLGRKEAAASTEITEGSNCHVVAPCAHERTCPLRHDGSIRLPCSFSQRLQTPSFLRLTKHSKKGHEDIEYSYVIMRRSPRPTTHITDSGRIGDIGRLALEKEALTNQPMRELQLHNADTAVKEDFVSPVELEAGLVANTRLAREEIETYLREESYSWPRLVFRPLKRSGHILLDGCMPDGKIMRMTVPKSQGKQPFYDARKSSWGDLFPHEPKHTPQLRYPLLKSEERAESRSDAGKGKKDKYPKKTKNEKYSYKSVDIALKAGRKDAKQKIKQRGRMADAEAEVSQARVDESHFAG